MEIGSILGLLRAINFKAGLINVDRIQLLEHLKLCDSININFNFDGSSETEHNAFITKRKRDSNDVMEQETFALLPIDSVNQDDVSYREQAMPFSSGMHIMIDRLEWWQRPEQKQFRKIVLTPMVVEDRATIYTLEKKKNPRSFDAKIDSKGTLSLAIWSGLTLERVNLSRQPLTRKNSTWDIKRHSPGETVTFERRPEIVLSFDEAIIKYIFTICRSHQNRNDEYYVLIAKK